MTFKSIVDILTGLLATSIPIAVGLCLIAFFWGIFQTFGKVDDAEKRKEGRDMIFWALIALFVVVTLGGIIQILSNTLFQNGA